MECLVTKLRGVINDDSLIGLNELRINFDMNTNPVKGGSNKHCSINIGNYSGGELKVKIIGNGYISESDSLVTEKEVTIPKTGDEYKILYFTDDVETISIDSKHYLSKLSLRYCRDAVIRTSDFEYCEHLIDYEIYSSQFVGDVSLLLKNYANELRTKANLILTNRDRNADKMNLYGDISSVLNNFNANVRTKEYVYIIGNNIKGKLTWLPNNLELASDILLDFNSISDVPASFAYSSGNKGKHTISGDISVLGTISDIKGFNHISTVFSTISGDISSVFGTNYKGKNLKMTRIRCEDVCDISKFKSASMLIFSNLNADDNRHIPCTWTKGAYSKPYLLALENIYMQSGTEDLIVDMSTKGVSPEANLSFYKVITIKSMDLSSATPEITAAISTLASKGVSVGITYLKSKNVSTFALSSIQEDKYAIVYKNDELIIEPTNLKNATVCAANDCTYAEFNNIEEANNFITSKGIKRLNI